MMTCSPFRLLYCIYMTLQELSVLRFELIEINRLSNDKTVSINQLIIFF